MPISSRSRALSALALAVVLVLSFEGLLSYLAYGFIRNGRRIDAINHQANATHTQLIVDDIVKVCSKSCSYRSVGHLTDGHGVEQSGVSVIPEYSYRNYGPIEVVYSPTYRAQAVPQGNNGDGDYWAGGIFIVTFILLDLGVLAFVVFRLHRRRRLRRIASGGSGTESVELRGLLHGMEFGTYSGPEHIRVTGQEIECRGHSIRLADVTAAGVSLHPVGVHGALYGSDWVTFVIDTASAQYYLTCSPDYLPLMQERLPLNGKTRTVRVN